jgi:hypothetical protein
MPFIQIKPQHGLTPETHKEIKLQAIKAGKTIPEYALECIKLGSYDLTLEEAKEALACAENKV